MTLEASIQITLKEALARLSTKEVLTCYFECRPNNGFTFECKIDRQSIVDFLTTTSATVYEAGAVAQSRDTGIFTGFEHKVQGPGVLFMETRRECRLNEQQLRESLERGRGADIFSQ